MKKIGFLIVALSFLAVHANAYTTKCSGLEFDGTPAKYTIEGPLEMFMVAEDDEFKLIDENGDEVDDAEIKVSKRIQYDASLVGTLDEPGLIESDFEFISNTFVATFNIQTEETILFIDYGNMGHLSANTTAICRNSYRFN